MTRVEKSFLLPFDSFKHIIFNGHPHTHRSVAILISSSPRHNTLPSISVSLFLEKKKNLSSLSSTLRVRIIALLLLFYKRQ